MVVGTLELCLRLQGCRSLKDKRQVLRSLMDRVRRDLRVSVAEVDDQDLWGNATVGVACVGSDLIVVEGALQRVVEAFDEHPQVEVESAVREIDRR